MLKKLCLALSLKANYVYFFTDDFQVYHALNWNSNGRIFCILQLYINIKDLIY